MKEIIKNYIEENNLKNVLLVGQGVERMLDSCEYHHLTSENSTLHILDNTTPDSYWIITKK